MTGTQENVAQLVRNPYARDDIAVHFHYGVNRLDEKRRKLFLHNGLSGLAIVESSLLKMTDEEVELAVSQLDLNDKTALRSEPSNG